MSNLNSRSVSDAISWICRAQDQCEDGGVAAAYMPIKGWSDAYPETTGYIIPTFLELAILLNQPNLKDRALKMGEWLLSIQYEDGSFPDGIWTKGSKNPSSVFNSGQILFGLCALAQHTGEDRWRIAGERCAAWLASVQEPDGSWLKFAYRNTLHTYKARVAWPMAIAGKLWGLMDIEAAARKNIDHALARHKPNGWIEDTSFDKNTAPVLHTFSYTVQGMLEAGILFKDQRYLDAAVNSATALLKIQAVDGSLPGCIDENFSPCWYTCLTGISQTVIIWARLAEIGDQSQDWATAAKAGLQYLEASQSNIPLEGLKGGFSGSKPIIGPYMRLRYPNWAVKFYLDAVIAVEKGMGDHAWG